MYKPTEIQMHCASSAQRSACSPPWPYLQTLNSQPTTSSGLLQFSCLHCSSVQSHTGKQRGITHPPMIHTQPPHYLGPYGPNAQKWESFLKSWVKLSFGKGMSLIQTQSLLVSRWYRYLLNCDLKLPVTSVSGWMVFFYYTIPMLNTWLQYLSIGKKSFLVIIKLKLSHQSELESSTPGIPIQRILRQSHMEGRSFEDTGKICHPQAKESDFRRNHANMLISDI